MSTRIIQGRIVDMTLAAEGIVAVKLFDEDPALYNQNAIGDAVDRTGYPNQIVDAQGSTLLRLMDIATLNDRDDGAGFYAAVRGVRSNWSAATLVESDDDSADFREVKDFDVQAVIGFTRGILATPESTETWDVVSTLEVELIGGSLESFDEDETLKARKGYLIGQELMLCQNVEQIDGRRWRLNGPMVRGWKGTEWAVGTHTLNENVIVLDDETIERVGDRLADIGLERFFKAVSSGQTIESAQQRTFTDTGVSLKPWAPVDIEGLFDGGDNVVITWRRRSRLQGRNGRDFFDPPLAESTESYEIDILSDDELTVIRTLTATSETVSYTSADQVTDWGGIKTENLHLNIYQLSADVGRGYPGHAVIHPSGESGIGTFDMVLSDGNPMAFEDGDVMEYEH